MKKLIEEAMGLINDLPKKQARFIYEILMWEQDMKQAYSIAYKLISGEWSKKSPRYDIHLSEKSKK